MARKGILKLVVVWWAKGDIVDEGRFKSMKALELIRRIENSAVVFCLTGCNIGGNLREDDAALSKADSDEKDENQLKDRLRSSIGILVDSLSGRVLALGAFDFPFYLGAI